ncbi:MAG: Lipase 2 precursor [Marmoricola sp.]|nr:Lipase 2 precursor [Marmoricola sp.]
MNRHDKTSPTASLPAAALRWTAVLVVLLLAATGCSMSSAQSDTTSSSPGRARSATPSPLRYVALGDSFTSAPLVPVTDVAHGCFRSSSNYPSLVADRLGAELDDRSCGGAELADLDRSQFPDVPAQLTALTADTDLVTIGIGGNDGGVFQQLTSRCPDLRSTDPSGAPCRTALTSGGDDVLVTTLARTGRRLATALAQVRARAPQARVLVVGYPQIVAAGSPCPELPLARGDYAWAANVNMALNTALRSAAAASGSTYVDVFSLSRGHDICSDDPWINGSVTDQKRAAAYHPFAVEQVAVADLVAAAARG